MKQKRSLLVFLSILFFSFGFALPVSAADTVADTSISDELAGANTSGLVVVPSPDGGDRKEYASTAAGLKQALYDLYQNGNNGDFAIYFGTNITAMSGAVDKTLAGTPSATNMTFSALEGKVNTLVLTSTTADEITDNTSAAAGAKTLTFGTNAYFGTNLVLRNITYTGTNLYMNGHDLSLNGNSQGNGLNVYGGSDNSSVTGSPTITVNATGSGSWTFSGGNNTGGTLTGDTSLKINNVTSTGVITILGGGNTANVNGNVSTEINSQGNDIYLGRYIGGVASGTITGSVQNMVKGKGRWNSNTQDYIGGSVIGNIGTVKGDDAITNTFDTSSFSAGSVYYMGANYTSGIITGNIKNTVKAGGVNKGSINRFDGAAGQDIAGSDLLTTSSDSQTPEQRRAEAQSNAQFRVYGDITNDILEGCISNNGGDNTAYTRGAGYKGYYEGNITTNVGVVSSSDPTKFGGSGFVYSAYIGTTLLNNALNSGISYRSVNAAATNYYGDYVFFDIVGGGGSNGLRNREIYIYGNTNVNLNNVLARWTYAGGFSGTTEGNSTMTMNGGVVDTLEGSGYSMYRTYGNSSAILNNGQVDDFFCGASWHDQRIVGNTYAEVNGGVVNATFGGNFGNASDCTITGNSKVLVRGGNFAGSPRRGWEKALSPGPTQSGSILGNTELTIDLRGPEGDTFVLPKGTNISAGKPDSARATYTDIGTDENNTMTLNIYTKPGSDKLNGAVLLGDAEPAANTKSGKVNININAPDSNIGNVYATEYSNISSSRILRDVRINLQNAASINGLSGGNGTDNFTNAIVTNSTNKSIINVGEVVDTQNSSIQEEPILVGTGTTSVGIINFTEMNVKNGIYIQADRGNIKNGNGATAANHGTLYNQFGDITLEADSGLGVTTTTGLISAGKLIVEEEGYIESSQGTGIINISDVEFVDPDNSRLNWIKNNTGTSPSVTANGTWFGKQTAYQVLTINPTVANASEITPFNFKGMEKATGKTFIGDNDITGTANGYGLMIPGSVIDYIVEEPVVDGEGSIKHNVTDVLPNNSPTPLKVWGTEVAGTKVQKGRLIIPGASNILPTLTFEPETTNTGSWFYSGKISSSKLNSTDTILAEKTNSDPETWTSSDAEYSYEVEVRYSNQAELDARSIILTESQAAAVSTEAQVNGYTEVDGRPFLESDIDSTKITSINTPLAEDEYYRVIPVEYTAGTAATNAANTITETVKIVIVKDAAVISADQHSAIYAENVSLKQTEMSGIPDRSTFESNYSHAFAIESDGSTHAVSESTDYFGELKAITLEETPTNVPVTYTYTSDSGEVISKDIVVSILPNEATLVVQFVDENGNSFTDGNGDPIGPLTYTRDIGTEIDLKTEQDVLDAIEAIEAQYYVLVQRPDANPIEIVNGGSTVTYRFSGTLSIFSAPTRIDFGTKTTGNFGAVYADEPDYDKPLVVKDTRANKENWTLTASLTEMMTSVDDPSYTLPESLKYKRDNTVSELVEGVSEIIITSHTQSASGDYDVSQAEWQDKDNGFVMDVSASQYRKLGAYRATIQFTLGDTP